MFIQVMRFVLIAVVIAVTPVTAKASGTNPVWAVFFSPLGGCTEAIVTELAKARSTIDVQAYSFTSDAIAKALLSAHKRGIKIRVILDKSQRTEKYSSADFLAHAGIETLIDDQHAIAHNKVMIIDGQVVITGSFNFTKAAENSNAENLLIIQDQKLAGQYQHNWQAHVEHSQPYAGR
jgi:phosphatidylserine/phosphatidylglycerophosphate/cardiolipin synthase-like enzyme